MGLFNKKNKASSDQKAPTADVKVGNKPKKNDLLNILNESVWERTLEDLKKNTPFTIKDKSGETRYIGFVFDTNDVGGFTSKEAKNDEAKGSVVEAIKMGKINTYIRPEMLMDDCFVIIPDKKTIAALNDFPMFSDIQFSVCTIGDDSIIRVETADDTDEGDEIKVDLKTAEAVLAGNRTGESLLPYLGGADGLTDPATLDGEDVEPVDDDEDIPADPYEDEDEIEAVAGGEDAEDDVDDIPDDIDDAEDSVVPPAAADDGWTCSKCGEPGNHGKFCGNCGAPQDAVVSDDIDGDDEGESEEYASESYDENDSYDDDSYDDITQDVVDEYVTRKFYSDDLGLEISTEPFDLQFVRGNFYIPFKEERGEGWLNGYVGNLAKDANTAMERKHEENLFRLREQYMRKMQACCEQIVAELDYTDQNTKYGKIYALLEATRQERLDHLDESVQIKRQQLEEAWQQSLEEIGKKAAEEAKGLHRSRYGRTHDADVASVEAKEVDEIERLFNDDVRRMQEERRADASKLLDQAINSVLDDLRTNYMGKALTEEKKQYAAYQRQIASFIDNNRKDEKARINALIEQQNRTDEVAAVRNQCAAQISTINEEMEGRKAAMAEQIEEIRAQYERDLADHDKANENKVALEIAKQDELSKQIEHLNEKYDELSAAKDREYEARVASFEKERESWKSQTDSLIASHKRSNLISTILIVAILIAALGIGFIIGTLLNVRKTSTIEQDAAKVVAQAEDGN